MHLGIRHEKHRFQGYCAKIQQWRNGKTLNNSAEVVRQMKIRILRIGIIILVENSDKKKLNYTETKIKIWREYKNILAHH